MWEVWKNRLLICIDKHAPMRSKRIGNKKSPWITHELIRKMRKRDFLKKKAERTKDQSCWDDFKTARNEVNNSIKEARGTFFGLRVEVLKLQSCIQDKLRSPSYYIIISTYDQS